MRQVIAIASTLLLTLSGCGQANAPQRSTRSADGYPIGEVTAALRSACSDLSSAKLTYKKALSDGWKIVAKPEQSQAAGYIALVNSEGNQLRLANAGADMILVPVMERTVAGEKLYLSIYQFRERNGQLIKCKLFDVDETRRPTIGDLEKSLGLSDGVSEVHTTTTIFWWRNGLTENQRRLEFAEINQNPVNLREFGFSGLMLHASQRAPLSAE